MCDYIDVNFSQHLFADELKRVGIKSSADFMRPVMLISIKAAIQYQIQNCNLSRCACDELLLDLEDRHGIRIKLDEGIFPDPALLPHSFSKGIVKVLSEQQRSYNCASWFLVYFLVDGQANLTTAPCSTDYPDNLSRAVYDEVDRADKPPEKIPTDDIACLMYSLLPIEESLLLVLFKFNMTCDDIFFALALPNTPVVRWGFDEKLGRIKHNALRRLYFNYKRSFLSNY